MASQERYPLYQIILDDFLSYNKAAVFLLFAIVISAVGTVWITHHTRLLTAEQVRLENANAKLNNQYVHQQLAESTLSRKAYQEIQFSLYGFGAIQKDKEVMLVEE